MVTFAAVIARVVTHGTALLGAKASQCGGINILGDTIGDSSFVRTPSVDFSHQSGALVCVFKSLEKTTERLLLGGLGPIQDLGDNLVVAQGVEVREPVGAAQNIGDELLNK